MVPRSSAVLVCVLAVLTASPQAGAGTRSRRVVGSAQATPLLRLDWTWSSTPLDPSGSPLSPLPTQHARIQWYNPRTPAVHEKDLNPALTKDEGADNERTVLELNVSAFDTTTLFLPATWAGVTRSRSRLGEDLSRTQYVEIWVNDRTPNHFLTHALLHYDAGRVSEDAFWERNAPPNGKLDTEDKNRDLKLDRSEDPSIDEDTGLDGLHDAEEPGYSGPGSDPNGDDYHYITGSTDYSGINNTERNGVDLPNPRPDTEDLNLDGILNTGNDYYEATIDLSDSEYVAVDVARDFAGDPDVAPDNGWRLFRIPVASFTAFGNPSWSSIQHERIWLDGMTGPANIQVGGVQILPIPASELPIASRLRPSTPNPFREETVIEYELAADGPVRLTICDVRGRLVRELRRDVESAGAHRVTWSLTGAGRAALPSGVYFCTLEAGGTKETRRIILLR